jgi:MFS family permease
MSRRQLAALFTCNVIVWTVGYGLIPLLPVLAAEVGATPVLTGYYLSFSYLALTLGTLAAGWLSDRLRRRKPLLILGGVVMIPTIYMMGRATNVWQLALLTATVWFCAGLELTSAGILAGLLANEAERGKVFGILGMTAAIGQLLGGAAIGPTVDRWDYAVMFSALSLFAVASPVSACVAQDLVVAPPVPRTGREASKQSLGLSFLLLVAARLMVSIGNHGTTMSRSLYMADLAFGAAAISSIGAVSGAVSLPLPPIIGRLSDRLGRKRFLILGYLASVAGFLVLTCSAELWHFWLAGALAAIAAVIAGSVGRALVVDLVPPGSVGRGMSLFVASLWVGAIMGFTAASYGVEAFGITSTFIVAALLSLIATALIIAMQPRPPREQSATVALRAHGPDSS